MSLATDRSVKASLRDPESLKEAFTDFGLFTQVHSEVLATSPVQRRIRPRSVAVATAAVRESTPSLV
ncbi:hypothetical protein CVV72_08935 [Amycolatopsis sp. TNS106]|nr:hypothetical protein CVV72_08935 [Amycolatopsis sp. TNS106]